MRPAASDPCAGGGTPVDSGPAPELRDMPALEIEESMRDTRLPEEMAEPVEVAFAAKFAVVSVS